MLGGSSVVKNWQPEDDEKACTVCSEKVFWPKSKTDPCICYDCDETKGRAFTYVMNDGSFNVCSGPQRITELTAALRRGGTFILTKKFMIDATDQEIVAFYDGLVAGYVLAQENIRKALGLKG